MQGKEVGQKEFFVAVILVLALVGLASYVQKDGAEGYVVRSERLMTSSDSSTELGTKLEDDVKAPLLNPPSQGSSPSGSSLPEVRMTYIEHVGGNPGKTILKYATIDNLGIVSVRTLDSLDAGTTHFIAQGEMAIDSSKKTHLVYRHVQLLPIGNVKEQILYKMEDGFSSPPEVIPFPYATGTLLNLD